MNTKQRIAIAAVHRIVAELTDRSGFDGAWDDCDEETQNQIQNKLAEIVEDALAAYKANIV
jgi:hypothetical protein